MTTRQGSPTISAALCGLLLAEAAEEHLGVWEFLWHAYETLGASDEEEAKQIALGLVLQFLREGLLEAGFLEGSPAAFKAWELSPQEAVTWISRAWERLGREPFTGDICWFRITPAGKNRLDSEVQKPTERS